MNFDLAADLHYIITQATTLEERVDAFHCGGFFEETALSHRRAERWRALLNRKDPSTFSRRLHELGLTEADVPRLLGDYRLVDLGALPAWADTLRSFAESIVVGNDQASVRDGTEAGEENFGLSDAVYRPLVRFAQALLRTSCGERALPETGETAWQGFEIHLTERLLQAGRLLVEQQWAVAQTMSQFGFVHTSSLQDFLGRIPGQRLLAIFRSYPVLARQCAVLINDWSQAATELLRRLAEDYHGLCRHFHAGQPLGKVVELKSGLSDSHDGGRTVAIITFESGQRVVYKPRSLGVEAHFSDLLRRLGNPATFRWLKAIRVWDRGEYGWAEFVHPLPCINQAALRRFYWRAGALLGCFHLAHGVDGHRENFIASGEHPILIDLDGLGHPQDLPQPFGLQINPTVQKSVMRTGMLPGGWVTADITRTTSALENDSNGMDSPGASGPHLPAFAGSPVRATRYAKQVMAGFRWAGRTLLAGTSEYSPMFSEWVHQLTVFRRRHILRSTAVYSKILRDACHPSLLKVGIDHSIELDALRTDPPNCNVTDQEVAALQRMDCPYFRQMSRPAQTSEKLVQAKLSEHLDLLGCICDRLTAK